MSCTLKHNSVSKRALQLWKLIEVYRYRVSGHAPRFPYSTVRRRWPRRTHSLSARRRTPHYLGEVREYLNTHFPGRWIARAAPIARPCRSPHLTALDFFLWEFVKDRVFVPPCLQMSLNSELELLPQLQKWRQRCYVACDRLTTDGTSAALPMEDTLYHNYPR